MKTLGIIGGVGPQTTSKVYLSLIELIRNNGGDKYPPILIYNLPFPFIIETEVIVQGINSEKMLPYLIDGANILEKGGADFGILPCNTLHKYINEIRQSVKFPFLSILEETVLELKSRKISTVGILATESTIQSKIYEDVLKENKINILYPTKTEQDSINNVIVELLNGVISLKHSQTIESVCRSLSEKGAGSVLLACTDLQLAISDVNSPIPVIDTTEVLIQAAFRELLKK